MIQIAIVLAVFLTLLNGKLIQLPKNVYVFTGETARMICSTDTEKTPADWRFRRYGSQQTDPIYESGFIHSSLRIRHTLFELNGTYDLVISNVQPEDAGTYICIDLVGMGERAQAELVVIESVPSCESNITSTEGVLVDNSCHLNPDYMEYKCRVKYTGNVPPILEWLNMEMLMPINMTTIQINENPSNELFAVNTFVVKSTRNLNGTYFVCHILNADPANEGNKTCRTPVTNILYAVNSSKELKTGDMEKTRVPCSVETNIKNCRIFWKASTQKNEVLYLDQQIIHLNQSVSDENAKNYECLGECRVSGQICTIRGVLIKLIPDKPEDVGSNKQDVYYITLISLLAASVTVIVLMLIGIPTFLRRRTDHCLILANKCICCITQVRYKEQKLEKRIEAFKGDFPSKFTRDVQILGDVLDAENGLVSCLLNKRLLTALQICEISDTNSWTTNHDLISKLLEYLPPKFEAEPKNINLFLEALDETKQEHVAKYLTNDIESDCRPMRDDELSVIDRNFTALTHLIEANCRFLEKLVAKKCITETHKRRITECGTKVERNRELLTIMKRRSYENFIDFKECLEETKQGGINVLLEGPVVDLEDVQEECRKPEGKYQAFPDSIASPRNPSVESYVCDETQPDFSGNPDSKLHIHDCVTKSTKLMSTEPDESSSRLYPQLLQEGDEYIDANKNYIEQKQKSLKNKLDEVFAQPSISKLAPQQIFDIGNRRVESSIHVPNTETVRHTSIAEEDDEAFNERSEYPSKPKLLTQISVGNKINAKAKHCVFIIAKPKITFQSDSSEPTPEPDASKSLLKSDVPGTDPVFNLDVVWQDMNKICSDNRQCCSFMECGTRQALDTTLKSSFDGVGKQVATIVFVFAGNGTRDGLIFINNQPQKLDDILRQISELHSTSLKKGHLPNHVTVMFVCSYGHCYTAKKYTHAMNVINYTSRKNPEIEMNLCKFALSTIFPKTNPEKESRVKLSRARLMSCPV